MTSLYDCGPGGSCLAKVYSCPTAPTAPSAGDLWFDTTNNVWNVYQNSAWIPAGGSAPAGGAAVRFLPQADIADTPKPPPDGGYKSGDVIVHNGDNGAEIEAGYGSNIEGDCINRNDMLIYDDVLSEWHLILSRPRFLVRTPIDLSVEIPAGSFSGKDAYTGGDLVKHAGPDGAAIHPSWAGAGGGIVKSGDFVIYDWENQEWNIIRGN